MCRKRWEPLGQAAAWRVGDRIPSGLKSSSFEFFRERETVERGPGFGVEQSIRRRGWDAVCF